jgi:hypothetical protein
VREVTVAVLDTALEAGAGRLAGRPTVAVMCELGRAPGLVLATSETEVRRSV